MLNNLKIKYRKSARARFLWATFKHPLVGILGYLYGAYLTVRYVDEYRKFPAIIFRAGLVRVHIRKYKYSTLKIAERLIVQPAGVTRLPCLIQLGVNAEINIKGEFSIGDGVTIAASKLACITIGGKNKESGSGITGSSIINAFKKIDIGSDTIIAWDTFITDSDWHPIEGSSHHADTIIGNHVWVAVGAKILKGAVIGDDSIVGCSAVVSSGTYPVKSLLAGVPAIVVKSGIPKWSRDLHEQDSTISTDVQ